MIKSDRTFRFDAPPDRLWSHIEKTDRYRTWWPWLRRFEGSGLVEGDVWLCVVQPPMPWSLRFEVTLDEVVAAERATATIAGDIRGIAELTVESTGTGSTARLRSDLEPASSLLRAAALAAGPVVRWTHDWVLDQGAKQLIRPLDR